jgi:Cys-tRNA(Pro)/Cys-tRNA(Cys) deacylase
MTPAVEQLVRAGIAHRLVTYEHTPGSAYGQEAVDALGLDADQVFKTLVADTGDELVVAVVPVSSSLDLKSLARAAGVKRLALAEVSAAERSSGYVRGGISPFGQRKPLRTFIDETAFVFAEINVSGGRRGLELVVAPQALVDVLGAVTADLSA